MRRLCSLIGPWLIVSALPLLILVSAAAWWVNSPGTFTPERWKAVPAERRGSMVMDLISHHLPKHMPRVELVEMLGRPDGAAVQSDGVVVLHYRVDYKPYWGEKGRPGGNLYISVVGDQVDAAWVGD